LEYVIACVRSAPTLPAPWDGDFWRQAATLRVDQFHPQSASTHPITEAKVLYDDRGLYLHFRVRDRHVRAAYTEYQSPVCQDSCAEFFVRPREGKGYFNFEINPLGTMLLFYVTDPTRVGQTALKEYEPVPPELGRQVEVHGSMARPTGDGEIAGDVEWSVQYFVPFEVFEHYLGPVRPAAGERWRANFYKCGDKTSKPHWAAWAPIGQELNFHQPDTFGKLVFAGR
jgi:hypothetical protein